MRNIFKRIWNWITNLDIYFFKFDRELKTNVSLSKKWLVNYLIVTGLSLITIPPIWRVSYLIVIGLSLIIIPPILIGKRSARRKINIKVGLISIGHKLIEISTRDTSEKGALIITDHKIDVGQRIGVCLGGFSGEAVILWNDSSRGAFGLGFISS